METSRRWLDTSSRNVTDFFLRSLSSFYHHFISIAFKINLKKLQMLYEYYFYL